MPTATGSYSPPLPEEVGPRVFGIDVSAAQPKTLGWETIAAAGIAFCVCKASESTWGPDPALYAHLAGARSVGIAIGAYHFLHSNQTALAQADIFVKAIGNLPYEVRPVLDWEDQYHVVGGGGEYSGARVEASAALDCAIAWIARVEALLGRQPIVYTGPGHMGLFRMQADLDALWGYDLWVAHYRFDPESGVDYRLQSPAVPAPWSRWTLWQYGGNRAPRLPGIGVDIDRDVFNGSVEDFHRWLGIEEAPETLASELAASHGEHSAAVQAATPIRAGEGEHDPTD